MAPLIKSSVPWKGREWLLLGLCPVLYHHILLSTGSTHSNHFYTLIRINPRQAREIFASKNPYNAGADLGILRRGGDSGPEFFGGGGGGVRVQVCRNFHILDNQKKKIKTPGGGGVCVLTPLTPPPRICHCVQVTVEKESFGINFGFWIMDAW